MAELYSATVIISRIKKVSHSEILLAGILLVAAVLRCWNLFSIPFMNDELSALSRTEYSSFSELINQGVQMDGHPPLVQVFLFYWVTIMGDKEWGVKLPFILIGIFAIIPAYYLSKRWFGETTALLVATFMASLQFTVMYSQLARPYISGMFFILMFVQSWIRIAEEKKYSFYSVSGYIITALACALDHHFCALTALIIGSSGLFLSGRKHWVRFLLVNAVVLVLYLPVLWLTFFQMGWKGLGWLGSPENDFLLQFFLYAFQFSLPVIILIAVIIMLGFLVKRATPGKINAKRILLLCWFLLPFLTGYFYSVYVSPVLQFSFMIFSFPFLLMLLFSFFETSRKWVNTTVVGVFLMLNIYTLAGERKHFDVFYRQPVKQMVTLTAGLFKHEKIKSNVSVAMGVNSGYLSYYEKQLGIKIFHRNFYTEYYDVLHFSRWLSAVKTDYIILGSLNQTFIEIAAEKFPYVVFKEEGFGYDYYCLSAISGYKKFNENKFAEYVCNFEDNSANWKFDPQRVREEKKNKMYLMDSLAEWGPGRKWLLDTIVPGKHYYIDASLKVYDSDENANALLVLGTTKNDSLIDWRAAELKHFPFINGFTTIHVGVQLELLLKSEVRPENITIEVLFWNNERQNLLVDDFTLTFREGNKYINSLFEKIEN